MPLRPDSIVRNRLWFVVWLLVATSTSGALHIVTSGSYGGDSATTPDSHSYLFLARDINNFFLGEGPPAGDLVRTPGYPLVIIIVAGLSRINLNKVTLPTRDWQNTNEPGRRLVRNLITFNQLVGFAIPLILYLLGYWILGSGFAAFVCSLAYSYDVSSLCYEFVVLTETVMILTLLLVLLMAVVATQRRSWKSIAILGLFIGWSILLRPSFLLLGILVSFAVLVSILLRPNREWRKVAVYFIIASILPVTWCTSNLAKYGRFFYTQNQVVTLQNFAGPKFVQVNGLGTELTILQKNVTEALKVSQLYGMKQGIRATAVEVGGLSMIEQFDLMDRANWVAINANRRDFIAGGWTRFKSMWTESFVDVKSRQAQLRLAKVIGVELATVRDSKLLFGRASFWAFVLASFTLACSFRRKEFWINLALWVTLILSFQFLSALTDQNEYMRHGMAMRTLINFIVIAGMVSVGMWLGDRFWSQMKKCNFRWLYGKWQ